MKKGTLRKLDNLLYFNKETLRSLNEVSENALSKNISRWINTGIIIKIKNGLYTTETSYKKNRAFVGYIEFIANLLRSPSYVSLEYVLSSYEILTKAVYSITSVTMKVNRNYKNKIGSFTYKSISKKLFTGYEIRHFDGNDYYIATKPKALFDYLYLKTDTLSDSFKNKNMVEELRLNMDSFTKNEINQLNNFAKLSGKKKTIKLIENVIKNASN